jgi:hypothetical protein
VPAAGALRGRHAGSTAQGEAAGWHWLLEVAVDSWLSFVQRLLWLQA